MQISYGEAIEALARLHWISQRGDGAFRARLRKLQGEGIPEGANPGKGKKVDYTPVMLIELAVAVELLQIGLSPADAAAIIKANRDDVLAACLYGIKELGDVRNSTVLLISPESLRTYSVNANDAGTGLIGAVSFVTRTRLVELFMKREPFEPMTGEPWRWSVIFLYEVILALMAELEQTIGDRNTVIEAFTDELHKRVGAVKKFAGKRLNIITVNELPEVNDGDT